MYGETQASTQDIAASASTLAYGDTQKSDRDIAAAFGHFRGAQKWPGVRCGWEAAALTRPEMPG